MTISYSGGFFFCKGKDRRRDVTKLIDVFSNISFRMLQKLQFCLMQHKYALRNGVMEIVVYCETHMKGTNTLL